MVDHSSLFQQLQGFDQVLNQRHLAHHKLLVFQIKAAQAVFRANHSHVPSQAQVPCGVVPTDIQNYPVPEVTDQVIQECPINPQFLRKFLGWVRNIQWEQHPVNSTSYLELCLEYIFSTKSYPPVPVEKFPNRKNQSGKNGFFVTISTTPVTLMLSIWGRWFRVCLVP